MCCGYICKNWCEGHGFIKSHRTMYEQGRVWCKVCEVSQPKPELTNRCPCCGCNLRHNPSRSYGRRYKPWERIKEAEELSEQLRSVEL